MYTGLHQLRYQKVGWKTYECEKLICIRESVYSTLFWSHENRLVMRVKRRRTQVVNEYVSDMQPFENDIEVLYNVTRVERYSPPKIILMSYLLSLVLLLGLFGGPTEYMKG